MNNNQMQMQQNQFQTGANLPGMNPFAMDQRNTIAGSNAMPQQNNPFFTQQMPMNNNPMMMQQQQQQMMMMMQQQQQMNNAAPQRARNPFDDLLSESQMS